MKNSQIIIFIILSLIFSSLQVEAKSKFTIKGTASQKLNGATVKVIGLLNGNEYHSSISTTIKNGMFNLTGTILQDYELVEMEVTMKSIVTNCQFFVKNGYIKIHIASVKHKKSSIQLYLQNTPFYKVHQEYEKYVSLLKQTASDSNLLSNSVVTNESIIDQKKTILLNKLRFYKSHKTSYASLYYFNRHVLNSPRIHPDTLYSVFNNLTDNLISSPLGIKTLNKIKNLQNVSIGSIAPNFQSNTYNSEKLNLKELTKSKYVLLCFWASWCGPCIKNFPLRHQIDSLYKNKGLQLISVSIDEDKNNWISALEKYNLPWPQTCNLKEYIPDTNVQEKYQVYWVPQYLLLNNNGEIIYQYFQSNDNEEYTVLQNLLKYTFQ